MAGRFRPPPSSEALAAPALAAGTPAYAQIERLERSPDRIDAHLGSGTRHTAGVGRISYLLGLQGPNLTIDTACSSALVAVPEACQATRKRALHDGTGRRGIAAIQTEHGCSLRARQADVGERDQVQALIQAIDRDGGLPPPAGILQAAGVLDDGLIGGQTQERFEQVFKPKAQGA